LRVIGTRICAGFLRRRSASVFRYLITSSRATTFTFWLETPAQTLSPTATWLSVRLSYCVIAELFRRLILADRVRRSYASASLETLKGRELVQAVQRLTAFKVQRSKPNVFRSVLSILYFRFWIFDSNPNIPPATLPASLIRSRA
jgi:hypothetical protein